MSNQTTGYAPSGLLDRVQREFPEDVIETSAFRGDETLLVRPSAWYRIAEFLRDDPFCNMSMFVDITAVDYPRREARFDLVLHLLSLQRGHRIRLKTQLFEEHDGAVDPARPSRVRSVTTLWLGANWFEREVWDMFGIRFDGHPDLRRILLYEEFEGHPLRKDYPAQRTQPLIPYRTEAEAGLPLEKLAPFAADEGMPWGRNDWAPRENAWGDDDRSALTTDSVANEHR